MAFQTRVFPNGTYAEEVARLIAGRLPNRGSVVLTGGTTVERVYPPLARAGGSWSDLEVLFSDERCVPPDDDESNFKMASDLLLSRVGARKVHRMRGEEPPPAAARSYDEAISALVEGGLDLVLLGMGADAHVGAMFPGSPALEETTTLCRAVDRPDGMKGLTLTPAALTTSKTILLLVSGAEKAPTVARVIKGDEPVDQCPARLLAAHPDATFLLDEAAASAL
jgi:6-phosphogluconolactonase